VHKQLHVWGDRTYNADRPEHCDPQPFMSMPIRYERAHGGVNPVTQTCDARNPIGVFVADAPQPGVHLPNIEHADTELAKPDSHRPRSKDQAPAGFGPLPAHWSPRVELAGTYDHAWQNTRKPLLPADFDPEHYQCAPPDQRAPNWLTGGEPVILEGLTPQGHTAFDLPHIALALDTRIQRRTETHPAHLHSVIIDTDTRHLTLVWHSALRCQGERLLLYHTSIAMRSRLPTHSNS
jgi:hypothetical protein